MDGMRLSLFAVPGLPEIRPGDDLAGLILGRLAGDHAPADGDVIVIAHKMVSKAEGRIVELAAVDAFDPGAGARSADRQGPADRRIDPRRIAPHRTGPRSASSSPSTGSA